MTALFSKPKMPEKSAEQVQLEKAQVAESKRADVEIRSRKMAARRRRGGRSSLISGEERGVKSMLG